jgi:DNA-binding Lrp family transcriptional regulator
MDELDRRIVLELRQDARRANVALASELGVSEKTVRTRIARLVDGGVIRFGVTVADTERPSRMLYLVHAVPGHRFEVAEALAARPEVDQVHLATGACDVAVAAAFPDDARALEFSVREIERRPDVQRVDSCHLISEVRPATEADLRAGGPAIDTELIGSFLLRPPAFATVGELLDRACELAIAGLSADRALASVVGDRSAGSPLLATRSRGLSDAYIASTIERMKAGATPVVARVIETGQHVLVPDARTDPLMAWAEDLVRVEGYRTFLTVPMMYGERVVGVLSLYLNAPARLPDGSYIATTQALADHLGIAWARLETASNGAN